VANYVTLQTQIFTLAQDGVGYNNMIESISVSRKFIFTLTLQELLWSDMFVVAVTG
jgi:hypothetical protein